MSSVGSCNCRQTAVVQLLTALHTIHSKGVLHLDIKPDNFLCSQEIECYLIDFGASLKIGQDGFATGEPRPWRRQPPEMNQNYKLTEHTILRKETDIYAVGPYMYEMLTFEKTKKMTSSLHTKLVEEMSEHFQFRSGKKLFRMVTRKNYRDRPSAAEALSVARSWYHEASDSI